MMSDPGSVQPAVTGAIATWLAETGYRDLPAEVAREAGRIVLDTLGCAIAGHVTGKGRIVTDAVHEWGGAPESVVLGAGFRSSCAGAAFANAELTNAIDFDAVFLNIGHIVPSVVPAALAVAERVGASGQELLTAVALGLELAARLTIALLPLSTSPSGAMVVEPVWGYGYGSLGAAAAAGKLLRQPADALAHALGLAAYGASPPSLLKWTRTKPMSMVKYSPMGWIAQAGVQAALLAGRGFTGDPTALDGPQGFWRFWGAPQCRWPYLVADWGRRWFSVEYLSFKAYPMCNLYRPHLWLLDQLMARENLGADDLEEIGIRTDAAAAADRPYGGEDEPSEMAVHNSPEYGAAMVALRIPPGPQWVLASIRADPAVQAFGRRVRVIGNPSSVETAYRPETGAVNLERLKDAGARLTVRARGKSWELGGAVAKGDCWAPPEARMSDGELAEKFRENCRGRLQPGSVETVIGLTLERLARLDDVRALTALAAGCSENPAPPRRRSAGGGQDPLPRTP